MQPAIQRTQQLHFNAKVALIESLRSLSWFQSYYHRSYLACEFSYDCLKCPNYRTVSLVGGSKAAVGKPVANLKRRGCLEEKMGIQCGISAAHPGTECRVLTAGHDGQHL